MADCYSYHPTENKAVNSDGTKCAVYKPTENKISVPDSGGGGGDGIKTINGVSPTTDGEFNIDFDESQFNVEKTTSGLKASLKSSQSGIKSISLNGEKISPDSNGNIDLQTENGIEGEVTNE